MESRWTLSDQKIPAGLIPFLSSTWVGSQVDLQSPLLKGTTRKELLRDFWREAKMDELQDSHPRLFALEQSEAKKFGPFSIRQPFVDRIESVASYLGPKRFEPDASALNFAIRKVSQLIKPGSLRPWSLKRVYESSTKSTNWGLPYFDQGSKQYLRLAMKGLDANVKYPSLLGWRGQASGTDVPKQRVVWMFPHSLVLHEGRYVGPLMEKLSQSENFGWDDIHKVRAQVHNWTKLAIREGYKIWSFDASKFDQSPSQELIRIVFLMIAEWFGTRNAESFRDLQVLGDYFATSPIVYPQMSKDGRIIPRISEERVGSVPSGSKWTAVIDALLNLLIQYYTSYRLNYHILRMKVVGDDAVVVLTGSPDLEDLERVVGELGFTANPEKQVYSTVEASFLQDLYTEEIPGGRALTRTLNSAASYERFAKGWNSAMDIIRWWSQLNNNNNHPYWERLITFIASRDKYQLGRFFESPDVVFQMAGGRQHVEETLKIAAYRGPGKELPVSNSPIILKLEEMGWWS
jgi:hypothetical protein